jgi:hypothetical protein
MYLSLDAVVDAHRLRVPRLAGLAGALHGHASRGWGPVVYWLLIACVALLVLPAALTAALERDAEGPHRIPRRAA